jgi:hypothetical protein
MQDASESSQVGSCSGEPPRGNQDLSWGQDAHHNSMATCGAGWPPWRGPRADQAPDVRHQGSQDRTDYPIHHFRVCEHAVDWTGRSGLTDLLLTARHGSEFARQRLQLSHGRSAGRLLDR